MSTSLAENVLRWSYFLTSYNFFVVDLKIEKGQLRSLFQLSRFRLAVEDALHLPVDMVTTEASDPDFLEMIRKEEVVLYRNA